MAKAYLTHITRRAELDISEAVDYIDNTLKNPIAADAMLEELDSQVASLSSMPEKYPLVQDPTLAAQGIRFVMVKKYLLFYKVDEARETVFVVRFLHSRRDWLLILQNGISLS